MAKLPYTCGKQTHTLQIIIVIIIIIIIIIIMIIIYPRSIIRSWSFQGVRTVSHLIKDENNLLLFLTLQTVIISKQTFSLLKA